MAKIPSRKFSTSKKTIASRGISKAKVKIPSRKLDSGTAKILNREMSEAPKAVKKSEAPVLLDRPADDKTRSERVAELKAQAKLMPASELR